MTTLMMVVVMLGIMFALALIGVPFAFAFGTSGAIALLLWFDFAPAALVSAAVGQVDSWIWLAVPLFLVLGLLMTESGITKRLIEVSWSTVGHIRGGLSHVTVFTNVLMAGMSGSYIADAAATGSILIPPLKEAGYSRGYASAIVACAAMIGPLIPPSINFIIIGTLAEVSVLRLWIGGIVPGLMVGAFLMITGYIMARRKGYPVVKWGGVKPMLKSTGIALPALVIPIVILGGMRLGIFTPTEAGASGVLYVLVVAFFIYREMKFKQLFPPMLQAVKITAGILFILAMANLMGLLLSFMQAGPTVSRAIISFSDNPIIFLFIVSIFLVFMGMFIDGAPLMFIFVPLLTPIARAYGVDLVQFGCLFGYCIITGGLTPPYGLAMFVTNGISGATVDEYIRDGWPLVIGMLLLIIPFILFSPLITWLPNLVMG